MKTPEGGQKTPEFDNKIEAVNGRISDLQKYANRISSQIDYISGSKPSEDKLTNIPPTLQPDNVLDKMTYHWQQLDKIITSLNESIDRLAYLTGK